MPALQSKGGDEFMGAVRVFAIVLAIAWTIGPSLFAQTAPDPLLPPGDAARGKATFESAKGNCLSCHRVNGTGSLFGPDLTAIAAPRGAGPGAPGGAAPAAGRGGQPNVPAGPTPQQLTQKLLDPNAAVAVQNRYVRLAMKDGKTITGKLLNIDTFAVQIFDSSEKLVNVSKANVRDMTMVSPMPSYRNKLTAQELSDIIGYLMSLKGQ
jgi:mono/diheme cytochrome c family protein